MAGDERVAPVRRTLRAIVVRVLRRVMMLGALAPLQPAGAQALTRPARGWESIEMPGFQIHFPSEMRGWVVPIAERMEAYADAVHALVGFQPDARVTVLVEDPSSVPNGFVIPLLEGPVVFLWPTPPAPSPSFGHHRGWGEMLAIHEYGHVAHLTIPSRNPWERRLWALAPSRIGPVARRSPPWVVEGYATWIEGRLTGNGRPNSVGRAAVLRQWALEGRLPTFGGINATGPYLGGAMRYLAGSAFLEWLVERKGEASLQHLWRRMSARQQRSFDVAFRGVYGAGADDLYGVFHTQVVERALAVRRELQSAGIVEGELVQKLGWGTGEPAVSGDGAHAALVLRAPNRPSRLVVWSTHDEGLDSSVVRARARLLERDPLDVLPFDSFPPPKRALQTLHPHAGRGHDNPRWFGDGDRLLVSRDEPLGDGAVRPDLFVWNRQTGDVRRVTRGAGIRAGDPSPDSRSAAGVRCEAGTCDLVIVDLATGDVRTLAAGSPELVWHRPRWSRDGREIAASVQRAGRWRIAIIQAATGAWREVAPGDEANRFAPSWTNDGRLVVVSERGGIANLELLDPAGAPPQSLTRVTGSVAAPEVGPDDRVWFLTLHAKGYDVRRMGVTEGRAATAGRVVAIDPALAPAAPARGAPGATFPTSAISSPRAYGLGPRGWRVLPGGNAGPDGSLVSLMVANVDPVGRLSIVAHGGIGERAAWRGGGIAAALRVLPVSIEGSVWQDEQRPSLRLDGVAAAAAADVWMRGAALSVGHRFTGSSWSYRGSAGTSGGWVETPAMERDTRALAFGELRSAVRWTRGERSLVPQISVHGSGGRTAGMAWRRAIVGASVTAVSGRATARAEAMGGGVRTASGARAEAFEQFAVGGESAPFHDPAITSQRVALPGVPVGFAGGRRLAMYRLSSEWAGFSPYAVWVSAGDSLTRFQRVLGLEQELAFEGLSYARLPRVRVRFGAAYSLDEPYARRLRPYAGVTYRP